MVWQKSKRTSADVFHAHVYCDIKNKKSAFRFRSQVKKAFNITDRSRNFKLGRWHDEPVGRHPRPMFLIWFKAKEFGAVVPWLSINHKDLSILVHPQLDDPVTDHTDHAMWIGKPIKLRLSGFSGKPPEKRGM
jgi:aromatic ring-cleaving dioxygenase